MHTELFSLDVPQLIDEAFEQAIPIIHKESDCDYAIIQITRYGIRIKKRVASEHWRGK